MSHETADVTLLLNQGASDDATAPARIVALLYDQFRQRARWRLHGERVGHSLQATDLAHEALKRILSGGEFAKARNRNELFRAFSRAMRQAIVDHARRRRAEKRGGRLVREELDEFAVDVRRRCGGDCESLHEAILALSGELPREAEVLELKYFGGFTLPEIAVALRVSLSTVERDCRFALAWLRSRICEEE